MYHEIPLSLGDCTVREKKNRVITRTVHGLDNETNTYAVKNQGHMRIHVNNLSTVLGKGEVVTLIEIMAQEVAPIS